VLIFEKRLSMSVLENNPAIYGWVKGSFPFQVPQGTTEPFFRPLRDLKSFHAANPALKRWAIFKADPATAIILDRNWQVSFHKPMKEEAVGKINRARDRAHSAA
jgi:hypothetical protein